MVVGMELMRVKLSELSWLCLTGMVTYLDLKKEKLKAMNLELLMSNYLIAR